MKLLILINALLISNLFSDTYRVFLSDKGPEDFTEQSEIYQKTIEQYSEKALARRYKTFEIDYGFTIEDAPLYQPYIDRVEAAGARVIHKIRWNNYLVVEAEQEQIEQIELLEFVDGIQSTGAAIEITESVETFSAQDYLFNTSSGTIGYGASTDQIQQFNIDKLHSKGFTGKNSVIGFLDSGFQKDSLRLSDPNQLKEEYDFVFLDDNTADEEEDIRGQEYHGTEVASVVLANLNDFFVGVSFNSGFYLAKTEFLPTETKIEEDNFVAGVEWLETKGVDVITSSLAYYDFQNENASYSFNDLDGNSTIVADIVNKAVHRGITFVNSAGNSGPGESTLNSPADADSVISVASTRPRSLEVSNFSSRGPRNGDGYFPNLASQGQAVFVSTSSTTFGYKYNGGTSFAAPLIAGASSVMLSAFPELRPWETSDILFRSAHQYEEPDDNLGYGVPDMLKAFEIAGIAIAEPSYYPQKNFTRVATNILSSELLDEKTLYAYYPESLVDVEVELEQIGEDLFFADLSDDFFVDGIASIYIKASNSEKAKRYPFEENIYFEVIKDETKITCGVDPLVLPLSVSTQQFELNIYETENMISFQSDDTLLENYEIYSLNGNLISSLAANSKQLQINKSNLRSGAYFVRINSADKFYLHKLIIQK